MGNNPGIKFCYWIVFHIYMSKLHIDSVTKSFDGKQVLTDICLSCEKGEIVGLLGRNGTGKSTLLKIIFGTVAAENRFMKIGNEVITESLFRSQPIKYLPENSFLPKHLKIKTIIDLFNNQVNAKRIKAQKNIQKMLYKKPREISSGQCRFLEVLLVCNLESKMTLLDEPFNGIAPVYEEDIKKLIQEQSKNKGFIITDHDYRNILDIATKVIMIYDGGTKQIKDKSELVQWGYIP